MQEVKPKKEVLRQSRVTSYLMCGVHDFKRNVEKDIRPSNYVPLRGTVTHTGREHNLSQKIITGKDCPLSNVLDATRDAVVKHFSEDDINMSEFPGIKKQHVRDQMIGEATALATVDYNIFQKNIQPLAVELKLKVELPDYPFDLSGMIDTITVDGWIRDLKTKAKSPNQSEADKSLQLTLYSLFYEANYKKKPKGLTLDCLVMLKKGVKPMELKTTRTVEDQKACLKVFSAVFAAIQKGVFLPCDPNFWKCSKAYCDYYDDCEYVNGSKKLITC